MRAPRSPCSTRATPCTPSARRRAGGTTTWRATSSPGLCPLAFLETDADAAWAEEWLGTCYELQAEARLTPGQKAAIHRAVALMRQSREGRTLTDFIATVQDADIRAALSHYAIDGPLGALLDSRSDGLSLSPLHRLRARRADGAGASRTPCRSCSICSGASSARSTARPALLLLDEAWLMLGHPVFREKIREWLKMLRKANCAVVLATQSLQRRLGLGSVRTSSSNPARPR